MLIKDFYILYMCTHKYIRTRGLFADSVRVNYNEKRVFHSHQPVCVCIVSAYRLIEFKYIIERLNTRDLFSPHNILYTLFYSLQLEWK